MLATGNESYVCLTLYEDTATCMLLLMLSPRIPKDLQTWLGHNDLKGNIIILMLDWPSSMGTCASTVSTFIISTTPWYEIGGGVSLVRMVADHWQFAAWTLSTLLQSWLVTGTPVPPLGSCGPTTLSVTKPGVQKLFAPSSFFVALVRFCRAAPNPNVYLLCRRIVASYWEPWDINSPGVGRGRNWSQIRWANTFYSMAAVKIVQNQ